MIALLSPAKTLDYETPLPPLAATAPRFANEADRLARAAANLSQKKLAELMHISPKLAKLNADRFAGFAEAVERPALFAFAGDVYTGFDVASAPAEAIEFAQGHVRILSGLYGLLRPLDAIRPYRLEMGVRWAPRRKSLYEFWGDRVADAIAGDVAEEGSGAVLNLASQEYWQVARDRLPQDVRVIDVEFHEADGRFVSFHAKKARGTMARWMCEHRIAATDDMRGFDADGYRFDREASENNRWSFRRAEA
ncbi:peroxide stress protein YaaA [Sphingomonas aracearum]|uniref:UPF0246 protein DVW87_02160 n=1 Tax=Sphingomonas aracearum TaxID=2283317 RepID=A0A369VVW6_9SPHN|nr:peroxide stress protein YaaA [Sphingomonas aracearum]RDE06534.1 peroxide stress protein YaaA [Sphingomonas aracearum]